MQREIESASEMGKAFTKEEVIAKLKYFAGEKYRPEWEELIAPSLRVLSTSKRLDEIPVGASRFGGPPDLPEGMEWPVVRKKTGFWGRHVKKLPPEYDRPLDLMAQINLADVAAAMPGNPLPQEGMLYFFTDSLESMVSFSDSQFLNKVAFIGNVSSLVRSKRIETPAKEGDHFCSLQFLPEMTMQYNIGMEMLNAMKAELEPEWEDYSGYFNENQLGGEPVNRMLGFSDPIQFEFESECESLARKKMGIKKSVLSDKDFKRVRLDWQLLLQLDSDSNMKWNWGDGGMLYFMIHREKLVAKQFDESVMILQCY